MGGSSLARVRKPARLRAGANGFGFPARYVPVSLDEILSLQQCASWLQQSEAALKDLIASGTLKPLPLPGSDCRLHARSVLQQMGVGGEALGNTPSVEAAPNRVKRQNLPSPQIAAPAQNGTTAVSANGRKETYTAISKEIIEAVKESIPAASIRSIPEPKEKVVRKTYHSHGRKVEVIYRLGDAPRHRLAEDNLLDVVVGSLKARLN